MDYTITLTGHRKKIIANEAADVGEFIQQYIDDYADRKGERLVKSQERLLKNDPAVSTMPASKEGILDLFFNDPNYENQADRISREESNLEE